MFPSSIARADAESSLASFSRSSLLYVALLPSKELVDIDIFSHSDLLAVSYRRHTTLVFVLLLNLDVLGTPR